MHFITLYVSDAFDAVPRVLDLARMSGFDLASLSVESVEAGFEVKVTFDNAKEEAFSTFVARTKTMLLPFSPPVARNESYPVIRERDRLEPRKSHLPASLVPQGAH